MGSYVEGSLMPGEQVVYTGKTSIWSLLPLIVVGVLTIWIFFIGIIFWVAALIRYFTTELAITNKRIVAKFGFISRTTIELNLNKAESIQVRQRHPWPHLQFRLYRCFRCRCSSSTGTRHF